MQLVLGKQGESKASESDRSYGDGKDQAPSDLNRRNRRHFTVVA